MIEQEMRDYIAEVIDNMNFALASSVGGLSLPFSFPLSFGTVGQTLSLDNNNVFLGSALESTSLPYIVINKISASRSYTHDGRDGTTVSRIQVNVNGASYPLAKTLASNLYAVGDYTSDTVALCTLDNELDGYNDTDKIHTVILDFLVHHYEEV